MIFLRYESFRGYLKSYPVTSILIALNLILFAGQLLTNDRLTYDLMFIQWQDQPGYADNAFGLQEPWRYITSIFVHGSLQHLFFNLFALLVFAPPLERLIGAWRYTLLYVLSGIAGNVLSAVAITGVQSSLGASGAIYGVYGAYLFMALHRKGMMDESSVKTVYMILILGVVSLLFYSNINWYAHLGGLIGGYLIYAAMDNKERYRRARQR
ncbi:rhomboid family intramembrane serine protease [Paenibacillus pasadenensis]|uniref:GlpG protein (Membrane protein of glp regulon) n=1 Tax=Paenibacillus pasadenensis TaxID=217090 RepID=A0A2N5N4Q9_9BACL|nr:MULTISPECIES: rhomboid family intramembrane serine protease [Paenibacillus]PLT45344.1 GlpG protein (membrane protein of glp regulon) [Paenibacillus pasadenensis]QGG55738.1 rhomboid family intramembrane serine protease [Paenibacillus sp. B01]